MAPAEYQRRWRAKHPEYAKQWREEHMPENAAAQRRFYSQLSPEKKQALYANMANWRKKNKDRLRPGINARKAVARAVAAGKIIKPEQCAMCHKANPLQAHHHNGYSLEHRFDVIWLCPVCHTIADHPS